LLSSACVADMDASTSSTRMVQDMPITPLASAMWRFGDAESFARQEGNMHSMMMSPGVAEVPHTMRPQKKINTEIGKTVHLSAAMCNTQCEEASALSTLEPVADAAAARAARYESVDPVTGRVWGVPSAFGRGQCLECPNKASPPSNKCRACQSRSNPLMHAEVIERVKIVLDKRLLHIQERSRADVAHRLGLLYADMKAGQIELSVQGQLQALAKAIEAHNASEARRLTATMVAQHWQQHKAWLKGIKSLLAEM